MLYKYEENGEKTEKCDDKIGQVEKNAHKADEIKRVLQMGEKKCPLQFRQNQIIVDTTKRNDKKEVICLWGSS